MTSPRFFCPLPLVSGACVDLPESAARHAARALRLGPGDAVVLFDGGGGEYACRIVEVTRRGVTVEVGEHSARECESPLQLTLVQALQSGDKMDFTIQKAVELGVRAIVPVESRAQRAAFLRLPRALYQDDPHWVEPLHLEQRQWFAADNPFYEHAEARFWLALRDGRPVGRISAQVDRLHLERHRDGAGFFGLLEAEDADETFRALLATAEAWLRARGLERVRGPFNLSINQECGLPLSAQEGLDRVLTSKEGFALIGTSFTSVQFSAKRLFPADATDIRYATLTNCNLQQVGRDFSRYANWDDLYIGIV